MLVLLQAEQDGPEGGSDEIGRTVRHDTANMLNGNAVVR